MAILGVIVVVILGLIGWCIFRFFKKKKPKGAEEKGKEDDENALVDNEEANAEEVSSFLRLYFRRNPIKKVYIIFLTSLSLKKYFTMVS